MSMICLNKAISVRVATAVALVLSAAPVGAAIDACTQTTKLSGGTSFTSDGTGNVGNTGYHYELWHDGSGSMKMTNYGVGAAFNATWNNAGDFLARVGLKFDETKTYDQYGNIVADYAFTKTGSGGGYSYIGIYGWTKNPLVEYYIVEDGFNGIPNASALGGAQTKGTLTVDGETYDIYTYQRVNKPSIIGNATFMQFWSIRRKQRQCGHISLSEHFKKWTGLGMTMGKMYEAKLLVEAGGGQGSFDMTYGTMQTNAPVSVSPEADHSLATGAFGQGNGVLSLVSLNGTVIKSVRQDESKTAVVSTDNLPKGLYLLRFQGEGIAPETRKLIVD